MIVGCFALIGAQDTEQAEKESSPGVWEEIQRLYEKAKKAGEKVPEDIMEWLRQDLKRIGTWEYRVVTLRSATAKGLEEKLNQLGSDRWESFAVLHDGRKVHLFFKRPVKSYLKAIPVTDLWKLIPHADNGPGS